MKADGTTTTVEITADIKTNGYKTSYDAPAEGGTSALLVQQLQIKQEILQQKVKIVQY
ncbi:hypothetical protein ACN2C3_00025 [Aliarcobacter butzleri]